MRIKKGFTLSEILIVLMIIGFIAALTVPSLMKSINEAQIKTAYKKAFNTISNLYAMEKIAGQTPITGTDVNVSKLTYSMANNLSIRGFANNATYATSGLDNEFTNDLVYCAEFTLTQGKLKVGEGSDCLDYSANKINNWIVTEDNLAYSVLSAQSGATQGISGTRCGSKAKINSEGSPLDAAKQTCAIIVVDTNGLNKGPNALDSQNTTTALASSSNMETLTGDWYYIYVGIDGVTPGPKTATIEGRILSDLK